MVKKNEDIRMSIREAGVRQWMVAELAGVSEATFNRWLRTEMTSEKKQIVLKAIESAKQQIAN